MICSTCQTANPDSARFCRNCGSSLQLSCTKCGAALQPDDRFCTACGQPTSTVTLNDDVRLNRLNQAVPGTLAEKIRIAEVSSDRKVVTALFADVVGSTALAEQMDAEEWTAIMNNAFDLLSPPIYRYEGTIARLMGDALLAFFGAPIAHEDDPVRAVHAALDIVAAANRYAETVRQQYGIEFAIRVGINTGPVIVGNVGSDLKYEYTAMGDAINLAARMQSAARPMTVLTSQHTQKFIDPYFDFADLGLIEVKGKAEPVHAYEVRGPKMVPGNIRGLTGLESPMVGRDAELAELWKLTGIVKAGTGRAAVILGEPGLGKSRLISEWKAMVMQKTQAQWVEGQCLSYGQEMAYHLVLSCLRSLIGVGEIASEAEIHAAFRNLLTNLPADDIQDIYPYLGHMLSLQLEPALAERVASLDPQSLQGHYVDSFRALLRGLAQRNPLILVFEDVHWADPSSVDLLVKVMPLAFQARILFCFVSRAERDVPGWRLIAAAHEHFGDTLLDIRLSPLSETDSHQLVSNLLEIQALPQSVRMLIYRKAEGNPFFVEEVIRMLIDRGIIKPEGDRWVAAKEIETVEIPDNLLGLLLARIDRQPDDVKRTMRIASVVGRQFPVKVLEQVLNPEEAQLLATRLSTLESSNLIRLAQIEPDVEYLFRHALIQDAAYESLLKKDRQRLHLAVGRILEILYPERLDELAPVIGNHFAQAGSSVEAAKYFTLAGDNASRKYANVEAIAHYSRAIDALNPDDPALLYLHRMRAFVAEAAGQFERARLDHEATVKLAQTLSNVRAEWQATLDLGFLWAGRDYGQAGNYFQQAHVLAQQLGDPAALAHSLNRVGNWHVNHEEPKKGEEYHHEALEIFQRLEDAKGVAESVDLLAMASWIGGRPLKTMQYYRQSVELLRETGDMRGLSSSLAGLGICCGLTFLSISVEANIPAADALMYSEEAVQIARSIGWRSGEVFALALMGMVLGMQGDYKRAFEYSDMAANIAQEIEHYQWMVLSASLKGMMYLDLGNAAATQQLVDPVMPFVRQMGSGYWNRMMTALLAYSNVLQNNFQQAAELLDSVIPPDSPAGTYSERIAWYTRAELEFSQGNIPATMRALDRLRDDAQDLDELGENRIFSIALLRAKALTEMLRTGQRSDSSDTIALKAEAALKAARTQAEFWPKVAHLWRVAASLGKLYHVLGRAEDAEREFAEARHIVNQVHQSIPSDLQPTFLEYAEKYMRL